jgi:antitoxin VapB
MAKRGTTVTKAKLFRNGGSQAVRLPAKFRFEADEVRVSRVGSGVLLEPIIEDPDDLFSAIDGLVSDDFMTERNQPVGPTRDVFS